MIQPNEFNLVAKQIFLNVTNGVMITDTQGVIVDVNPSFCRMTGYAREEIIGQVPEVLHSGYHDQSFYASLWEHIQSHGYWEGEIWNRHKNGEVYPEIGRAHV